MTSLSATRCSLRAPVAAKPCAARAQAKPAAMTKASKAGAAAAASLLASSPAIAAMEVAQVADSSPAIAVAGIAGIVGVGALLISQDPEKRRQTMAEGAGGDEMESVKNYFDTEGFNRWKRIYGETDDVNKVQLDIRTGHAQTVEKVLGWLKEEGGVQNVSVADCGCGTGSLAVPLALEGAAVSASDISAAMVGEAEVRYNEQVKAGAKPPSTQPKFWASNLEDVEGKYHTVTCLDVMIHYPQDKADAMITHLASLADERLIISFAPKTLAYSVLKRIGELFPGPSKATRAYLHAETDVEAALNKAGWTVTKREMTATQFYFSRLLEAKRA